MWTGRGNQPSCPPCTKAKKAANQQRKNVARRVATNPDHVRSINLRSNLSRHGMTVEQYRELLVEQDGCCAICGDRPDPNGKHSTARLHVDHHHGTGQNRALLCGRCNVGVGYFRENPALFRAAADYIERHNMNVTVPA
jgi:hypothetical protein